MSGLRTPTALFLLLTLVPAAILAFIGWRALAPLVDELTRAARSEVSRVYERTAAELSPAMRERDEALGSRLAAAAAVAREQLAAGRPGRVFLELEQTAGCALSVRTTRGTLLPRGPAAAGLEHLPEWPRFVAFRTACDRGVVTEPPPLEAPALRALAAAIAWRNEPARAAAALRELSWPALVAAGPLPCMVLAESPSGRELLRSGLRDGWLLVVPAIERARLDWFTAAGAEAATLQNQRLRARAEAGEALLATAAPLMPGVELVALRDPRQELAALAPGADGDCGIELAPAERTAGMQFTAAATAGGQVATPWGVVAIRVVHRGLPAIQAAATRQRLLTGIGIALLLALMATGMWLVRRALVRERRARQLRDDFIANVSHELKTPLTGLRLHAEMLAGDGLAPATRERYGEVAQAEGSRLSALVDDLLDFAALERGRKRLEPEPVDLAAAAAAVARAWQVRAERDGVLLRCEAVGEAHALVDATAFSRILTNLLQNAFRHGRPPRDGGRGRVTIHVGPGPRVAVADNGPGVPPGDRERIFARFERGRGDGVGLGLALSRELAQACGGALACSDDGAELSFTLVLPAVPELPLAAEATA